MKVLNPLSRVLDHILGQRSKIAVLRVLYDHNSELNGREVARRAGINPRSAHSALNGLVKLGLLQKDIVGNNHVYSINPSSYLSTHALGGLFAEERLLPDTIAHKIGAAIKSRHIISIAWFGSTARGKRSPGSDLDLLVVIRDSRHARSIQEKIASMQEGVYASFGVSLNPYVIGAGEMLSRYNKQDVLIRSIVRDAVVLHGQPLAEVLADEP